MMDGALAWLAGSALSQAMRGSTWLYPIVEIVHICGFCILVGAVVMFDLRVLGWARALPLRELGRHILPWSVASLLLIVPAGVMMFSAHPAEMAANRVFQLKLLLIAIAGVNAAAFHLGPYRCVASWDTGTPAMARLHAAASIALWLSVISCGRLLAYV